MLAGTQCFTIVSTFKKHPCYSIWLCTCSSRKLSLFCRKHDNYWLGLYMAGPLLTDSSTWSWLDGSPFNSSLAVLVGQNASPGENYARMRQNGKWNDQTANKLYHYVCKVQAQADHNVYTILYIHNWHLLHACFYQVKFHSRHTMSKLWSVCM